MSSYPVRPVPAPAPNVPPAIPPAGVGYLTADAAARFLSVSVSYLNHLRWAGGGPKYVHLGAHAVRYTVDDLRAWMTARTVANTVEGKKLAEGVAR